MAVPDGVGRSPASSMADSGTDQDQEDAGGAAWSSLCCRGRALVCCGAEDPDRHSALRETDQLIFSEASSRSCDGDAVRPAAAADASQPARASAAAAADVQALPRSLGLLRWVRHELAPISERSEPLSSDRAPVLVPARSSDSLEGRCDN
mmetsp:Transcript_82337/g.228465  ORF Transcript_82337/g.228465 Transcript_82337/m.228465 type:complete len:150 (-) Transcript_82337:77-526(-)